MKIKLELITNSSSSNFVVAMDKRPKTYKDINIPEKQKAEAVLHDTKKKGIKITDKSKDKCIYLVAKELEEGYVDGIPSWFDIITDLEKELNVRLYNLTREEYKDFLSKVDERADKIISPVIYKMAEDFVNTNMGKILYVFGYSDNDGAFYSEMEHGGTFKNYPHIVISHH